MKRLRSLLAMLERHSVAVSALTGLVTMAIALAALIGVKVQIDASARVQREQSARDIYREYLNLSISRPEFARPEYCAIQGTANEAAYESYVDYLLYTAEQAIAADPDWQAVFDRKFADHTTYLCSVEDWDDLGPAMLTRLDRFRAAHCRAATLCPDPAH